MPGSQWVMRHLTHEPDWLKKMRLVADLTDFPPMGRGPDSGDPGGDASERGKTLGFSRSRPLLLPGQQAQRGFLWIGVLERQADELA